MEKISTKSRKAVPVFVISFVLLMGGLYSTLAKASTLPSQPPGNQLAYFIGYHSSPGVVHYGPARPHRHSSLSWTGWRNIGHGCRKSCLVDRWSGRVVRCKRVCGR